MRGRIGLAMLLTLAAFAYPILLHQDQGREVPIATNTTGSEFKVYLPLVVNRYPARFYAWTLEWYPGVPIPLQHSQFGNQLDARQDRQFLWLDQVDQAVAFAREHPGELYIYGDEPDQHGISPGDYAVMYHNFVVAVRVVDPAARFSPAGFAQPSDQPGPHFTVYAQQFYDAYVGFYGEPPSVTEWRFHAFSGTDLTGWKALVNEAAGWSQAHGAPMVLGSFGFPATPAEVDVLAAEREMIRYIKADSRIVAAVWWSMDWYQWPHTLLKPDGSLAPEGEVYIEESRRP